MSRFYASIFFLFSLFHFSKAQGQEENTLLNILHQHPEQFDSILQNPAHYRLQIIYTQIDRDKNNKPHLSTWCVDTGKYFYYSASMVKMLAAPLVMEKINRIRKIFHVSIYDSLLVSGDACGDVNESAWQQQQGFCTPAQLIKEMLLVSNNHAFNPLYDYLTQSYFNLRAHELGYSSVVITNRFATCDTFQNRISSTVDFFDRATGKLKYLQKASVNPEQPAVRDINTVVGIGFLNADTIGPPKDFRYNNYASLYDLHRLLTHLIFPQLQPPHQHLDLTSEDYAFLQKYMGMYPVESVNPVYDTVELHDTHFKFFITPTDTNGHAPPNLRVFNKVGWAYGFMTDCSYVADTLNKVEFFLSCTMYVNNDEILNDEIYEYDQTAFPFFRNLFSAVYQYELGREKKYLPVFEKWDFTDKAF